jgi:hypothetical protein
MSKVEYIDLFGQSEAGAPGSHGKVAGVDIETGKGARSQIDRDSWGITPGTMWSPPLTPAGHPPTRPRTQ